MAKSIKNPELQELAQKTISIEGMNPDYYEQVINEHQQKLQFLGYMTPDMLKFTFLVDICEDCDDFFNKHDFRMKSSLRRHLDFRLCHVNHTSLNVLIIIRRLDRNLKH